MAAAANDDSSGQKCIENAKQIMDDIFGCGKVEIITFYLLAAELMCLTNRTKEAGRLQVYFWMNVRPETSGSSGPLNCTDVESQMFTISKTSSHLVNPSSTPAK